MNILIIEDEVKIARALAQLIVNVQPEAKIVASKQSISGAVLYLTTNNRPDLIFMDIQLADGLCFEIFKEVKIVSPVVFCTAYDDYAIEAFKSNGIDYILKPFSKETILKTFEKVNKFQSFFQNPKNDLLNIEALLNRISVPVEKKSFLVFKNNRYITIASENIAFFYIRNEIPTIVTFDEKEYGITQSLDEVRNLVSDKQFFRLNRQYLINFAAVKEVEHYFSRKLLVKLVIPTSEQLIVGKDKATIFLGWLEKR
ncbi:LytR/AlgR family response regulator transcription factor [Mucilaginibacter sp. McL0603]|uniref:LytR/AlgR family response regulator transcription factor n=1 Tax=Mucilaginibacter sp. McL0603 TaxID=3415670 RepID=UPI003CEE6C67